MGKRRLGLIQAACILAAVNGLAAPVAPRPARRATGAPAAPRAWRVPLRLPSGPMLAATAAPSTPERTSPAVQDAVRKLLAGIAPAAGHVPSIAAPGHTPLPAELGVTPEGFVRALGAPPGYVLGRSTGTPAVTARGFARTHAVALGVSDSRVDLTVARERDEGGRRFLRLGQSVSGVPVFGAGMTVQVSGRGEVEFVLNDLARIDGDPRVGELGTTPVVAADVAATLAKQAVAADFPDAPLTAGKAELEAFVPSVVGAGGPPRLVWRVEVSAREARVDDVLLVDARTGAVAFRYSLIASALYREIHDCGNLPGASCPVVRVEGEGDTGIVDADLAYRYLGDTYDFYFDHFGRDSLDGAGMSLIGYVRYCALGYTCPYPNAYWDGAEMMFGSGFAGADDVVAHELTHGVTQNGSNLIYWGESGAINESMSDIFGEFVDLTNGSGTDTPEVRWLIGEDLPGGAIRDMADPPAYSQPDTLYGPGWWYDYSDSAGVHFNSGVANKLAFLLTDGADFGGFTVTGMGIDAVAALFYEANTALLAPASDYRDLYWALRQAAVNLAWTDAQRANLERACRAVAIAVPQTVSTLFSDGFEGSFPGPWAVGLTSGAADTNWGRTTYLAASGSASAWCAAGGASPQAPGGDYVPKMGAWLVYGPFSLEAAADAWVAADVWSSVEEGYDFLYLATSTDGSNYVGVALSGSTYGWVHPVLGLRDELGQSQVWIAFYFTSDNLIQDYGSYVDDVVVETAACAAPDPPVLAAPAAAGSDAAYTVSWTATSPLNSYEVQESEDAAFTSPVTSTVEGTSWERTHSVAESTTYSYRVRALDHCAGGDLASDWSETGSTVVAACPAPEAPVLTAPSGAASGAGYEVTWTATNPEGGYEVQEATDDAFSDAVTVTTTATAASYSHTVLSDTTYHYRVRATGSCGDQPYPSAWSAAGATVVAPDCDVTVTGLAVLDSQLFESCGTISVGPSVGVTSTGNLVLRAANLVVIRNGFSVSSGGRLTVALDPTLAP